MNLALLIESLDGGGSERVAARLALGLARRGHDVFVYCLRAAGTDIRGLETAGVTVRQAHGRRFDLRLLWRLFRWLRRDRIQVVHAHSCAALVWIFPVAKLLSIPLLHVWHGWPQPIHRAPAPVRPRPDWPWRTRSPLRPNADESRSPHSDAPNGDSQPERRDWGVASSEFRVSSRPLRGANPPLATRKWKPGTSYSRLARYLDRFVECVGVNSWSLRPVIAPVPGGRQPAYLPNGIDLPRQEWADSRKRLEQLCGEALGRPVILTVCNVRPEKDLLGLLQAFAALRPQWPEARLVCVGSVRDQAYWHAVQEAIRDLGLTGRAYFTGPYPDAWRLMAGADVFCLPSRSESMPNVILEAMSQQVPIVATAVGDVGPSEPARRTRSPSGGTAAEEPLPRPKRPGQGPRQAVSRSKAGSGPAAPATASAGQNHYLLRHNETALLVPPGQPEALAAALADTLRDRQAARRRAARALADYRRRFGEQQMVRRYERVYQACAANPPRAGRAALAERAPQVAARTRTRQGRPAVLMVGPAWPQMGGMVTSIDLLMRSRLRERYRLHRYATTTADREPPARRSASVGRVLRSQRPFFESGPRRVGPDLAAQLSDSEPDPGAEPPKAWSWLGKVASAIRHVWALVGLARTILRWRIDLVHIHTCSHFTFYRNLLDLLMAKLLRCATVVHIRGGQFDRFCRQASAPGQWLIRRGLRWADAIVVLSQRWRHALRPYTGSTPVYVVPNAVEVPDSTDRHWDRPRGCPPTEPERQQEARKEPVGPSPALGLRCRFLYMAPLTEAKGLDDLIQAASRLRKSGLDFELVIAGPSPEQPPAAWEQRARRAGLSEVANFVGPVTGAAKTELLAQADCLVHPSHSEGMPNAVLEAAAAGRPVIATAVGSLPELMQPTPGRPPLAPLVSPHNPAQLAHQMQRLALDPELRRRIGEDLRRHVVAHCSLDRVSARLARIYRRVLQRRGVPRSSLRVATCRLGARDPKPSPWNPQLRPEHVSRNHEPSSVAGSPHHIPDL